MICECAQMMGERTMSLTRESCEVQPAKDVQLRLLEGFELAADGVPLELQPSAQRLVAFLALQQRPVVRAHVAGTLWGHHSEERAAACLRSAVWRANNGVAVIDAARTHLRLHEGVHVDARAAVEAAHAVLVSGEFGIASVALAGELLPGWYDDWVLVERERIRQLCLQAMERMAESLLTAGKLDLAIEAALGVVSAEPLRESAHRVLVDAYVAAGNRGEALRQYDRCCAILRSELGLLPSEALAAAAARAIGPSAVSAGARELLQSAPVR
jgi:DNA-binding SARP family transcriptional activator